MSAVLRIEEHNKAITLMNNNRYFESIEALQTTHLKYGPHVGLLSDLVSALYLTGRSYDCYNFFKTLLNEFKISKSLLSEDSQINTLIFMSKIHEEYGEISESIFALEEAYKMIDLKPQYQERVFANQLRLRSSFGDPKNLNTVYLTCLNKTNMSNNLKFEIEHSLVLAELALFGVQMASTRILKMIESVTVSMVQKRLLIFDISDYFLIQKAENIFLNELIKFEKMSNLTEYESIILNYSLNKKNDININYFTKSDNSLMEQLRIIRIQLIYNQNKNAMDEYLKKIVFLTSGLKSVDQKIIGQWLKTQSTILSENQVFEKRNQNYFYNHKILKIKNDKFLNYLFDKLKITKNISIEEVCEEYYIETLNLQHYDRIRMAIKRLNDKLKIATGIDKVFNVTKNYIEIENEKVFFK